MRSAFCRTRNNTVHVQQSERAQLVRNWTDPADDRIGCGHSFVTLATQVPTRNAGLDQFTVTQLLQQVRGEGVTATDAVVTVSGKRATELA